jgi:hypothetical protein
MADIEEAVPISAQWPTVPMTLFSKEAKSH